MVSKFQEALLINSKNIAGWRTHHKIVVIESDDWGSIRMSSKDAFNKLLEFGIPVQNNHYNLFDSIECNTDLEYLFETLTKFRDQNNRHPVFTTVSIVANPDFKKIKDHEYNSYFYEPFTETLNMYPQRDKVFEYYNTGIINHLFVPVFHGREHLNVKRWLKALQAKNDGVLKAFEFGVTGIPKKGVNDEKVPDFQAAFDLDNIEEIGYHREVLVSGIELFKNLFGYNPAYFVPTNGPFNNSLEETLFSCGIRFINSAKIQKEPLGNGEFQSHYRYLGKRNSSGQYYLTRNCFFEPSSSGYTWPRNTDWVNRCLSEIEAAFRWHKPATISTHRVNYAGFLHPENRGNSLKQLEELLRKMLQRWPDIEFMTSVELGDLIALTKK